MDQPLVSVVIPAYNCRNTIVQSIESVLIQGVPLEIIVVDDCSSDNLHEVLGEYLNAPFFRYIKNEKNMGVAKSRNYGVSIAKGKYIAFLDADDYWAEDKLKKQLQLIQEKNAVICSTARELIDLEGNPTGYIIPVKTVYTYRDLLQQNHVNCSSVLLPTEIARQFPMHHDDGHEDYLMWLEILQKHGTGYAINEPLLKYRISNTGKSGNKLHSAKMTYRTYRHLGMNAFRSTMYFVCYAFFGVKKYMRWFLK